LSLKQTAFQKGALLGYLSQEYRRKYTEHKAGIFGLVVGVKDLKSLRSLIGAWISNTWQRKDFTFAPELKLNSGWQREYFDNNHSLGFSDINFAAPSATQTVIRTGRNIYLAGSLSLINTVLKQAIISNGIAFLTIRVFI
jgi:hypothetical protein